MLWLGFVGNMGEEEERGASRAGHWERALGGMGRGGGGAGRLNDGQGVAKIQELAQAPS